jgi:hypothetical protein
VVSFQLVFGLSDHDEDRSVPQILGGWLYAYMHKLWEWRFLHSYERYNYLHALSGADEVIGGSWQLVTAIHDEGSLVWQFVSKTHKVMTGLIVVLPSNMSLWSLLWNLIDVFLTWWRNICGWFLDFTPIVLDLLLLLLGPFNLSKEAEA